MKKLIVFSSLASLFFVTSCKETQAIEQTPAPAVEQQAEKSPIAWLQNYFGFGVKKVQDSVLFYNSSEISMDEKGKIKQEISFDGGVVNIVEDNSTLHSKVNKLTPGKLIKVEYSLDGKFVVKMIVSFDMNSKKYELPFILATNGTYLLNGQPSLNCRLMFYLNRISNSKEASDAAEGWRIY